MRAASLVELEPAVRALIARDAVKVPAYPGVVMKLNQIVQEGKFGVTDLVRVVSADPAIAAALLRYANSAAVRGGSIISALPDAVSRLGSDEVVRIALAASLGAEAAKNGPLAELRRKAWEESLTSGICCMHLAPARGLDPRQAFVCGLLHDFGRLIAIGCLETILVEGKDTRALPPALWLDFVDGFHVELGVLTAARWKLAPVVQSVIANHHRPAAGDDFQAMVDLVIASDGLVGLLDLQAEIGEEDLEGLPYLSTPEIQIILRLVPQIAPFLAGLAEAAPPPAGPAFASQVTPPPSALEPPTQAVNLQAKVLRTTGEMDVKISVMGFKGLAFTTPEKLADNHLCKLRVFAEGEPFEIWAHVLGAQPAARGFHVEAKLFALNGPAKDRWYHIFDAVRASRQPPATLALSR